MTLRDFCGLSERSKTEVVELWGDQLNEKVVPGFQVRVFSVFDFYVEVYQSTRDNRVTKHRACYKKETVYN